jgi:AraC family transcriptional regulator, L-rhamnose operon regulatory protein RhaS
MFLHPGFLSFGCFKTKELPLHRNQGMEITFVEQGHLNWLVDGVVEDIPCGSVFVTLPWQAHGSQYVHEPGNLTHFVLVKLDRLYRKPSRSFLFHPSLQIPHHEARRISRLCCATNRHTWPASKELQWLLRTLVERLEEGDETFHSSALLMALLAELAETLEGRREPVVDKNVSEDRVKAFLARLGKRCAEEWTLSRMVKECRLSKTLVFEIFRKMTGDSPLVYLKRLRVRKAETMLAETNDPVTDIAYQCGFASSQHFARVFKYFTNQSPTEFRTFCRENRERLVLEWTEKDEIERFRAVRKHEWI